ncbi:MAG: methyltransferase domain-containing protein [Alphaproteobacteria bacterium]|nr:methyltransferase domain-containing protein [Alphaproteobacteria bacterium]MBV9371773.1 methyltransferase domain-containing protein [Alphaproteobacteria bacterium]MBV9902445.1 methyltransferase domain-containing protein [Alphaproteobacteria bacterium]
MSTRQGSAAKPPSAGRRAFAALLALPLVLGGCHRKADESPFPAPRRPVSPIVSASYSNEDARDSVREAQTVMELAAVQPGMYVADIGAGEGYYTVRLAPLVGKKGRVLAEDIVRETRDNLARRVQRENLENVAVKLGTPNDPQLPDRSFDRIFMIHMYHEIERPSEFLWHLRDDLKPRGRIVVVDADRPTDRHGTPPRLLVCEFSALGYELARFERLAEDAYFAEFEAKGPRPEPKQIPTCPA